ncbi:MAG: exopolysaccharide biosynthesis protein [Oceanicaulis sp.]
MGATASGADGRDEGREDEQSVGDPEEARQAEQAERESEHDENTLEGLMQSLCEEAGEGGEICVDDILDRLAHRSYGPIILIPSLIAIFPVIGALPLVSYTMALLIFLIAIQAAVSKQKLWLPGPLRKAHFKRDQFRKGLDKARPVLRFVDGFIARRLTFAFKKPWPMVVIWLCAALGALMLVYASVPGGVMVPGVALVLLSLGLTTHDGLVVALGAAAGLAAIIGSGWLVMMML